jgi:2-aminoethylphosphonate-pyruvate transaminase
MQLLNPGPVTLTERVRRSLLQADLCHRENEFFDLQDEARMRLLATYALQPATWTAVLMTASGTAAVESMVASLVPKTGRLLIVENGVYGERIAQICALYGIAHERAVCSWLQAPSLAAIAAHLDAAAANAQFTHLAVVHHETTSGRLNDLRSLGQLCRARGIGLLVDGVSSFGAEALDFTDSSLAAVAAIANKCLHGVPGVAFAAAPPPEQSSVVLRAYRLPAHLTYAMLHDALKAEGFVIYAGQGDLSKTHFRISTMGDLNAADIERLLECCAELLRAAG